MRAKINLAPMLTPKSVAVIGASANPEKMGHIVFNNFVEAGYLGELYPVNLKGEDVLGFKGYASVRDIKKPLDLAVIVIPAVAVPQVLTDCGNAKVKSVVVISGGFAEIGDTALQQQIVDIANKYNISMLGPNCLGVLDSSSKVDTLFLPASKMTMPRSGSVSLVMQSGALGSTMLDVIAGEGFGLSKFISYGNAAQVDEVDILDYLADDDETKVIVLYIEGIKRGKEFVEAAKRIGKKKPVVVLKAGRTSAGVAAARSHTASLAGDYKVQEAIFKQFGFIVADDFEELKDFAKIFSAEPLPEGNRVAIITNGGGAGVITADAVASSGKLNVTDFSNKTKKELRKVMPLLVGVSNPLDLVGDADEKRYENAINLINNDPNTDMIVVIALFQTPGADEKLVEELVKQKIRMAKPMLVISIGSEYTLTRKRELESGGVPVYASPSEATKALEALLEYAQFRNMG